MPGGSAPAGHSSGALQRREGAQAPWLCWLRLSPPGCHLCPTLPKGRRGLAAGGARWERRQSTGAREAELLRGKMSSGNGTSPTPPLHGLLEPVPPSATSPEGTDWLPIIVGLVCIFLVLATLLTFVTLCHPPALGRSLWGPQEWLPQHPMDASQPQLRLWKPLGSLRGSISSFRRSQMVSQSPLACPRSFSSSQDWDIMESTKM
ncbi:uncharacterized protein C10orf105 homolog [Molothrus ater]|uniref:uncharacterized protein C10orf105 homolog n=1 Tax=Molothrus ater TaxID=84834 RepID=UPI00174B307C|nr:uncharacterized protein C10orf105 homolog [Molothrus ater]